MSITWDKLTTEAYFTGESGAIEVDAGLKFYFSYDRLVEGKPVVYWVKQKNYGNGHWVDYGECCNDDVDTFDTEKEALDWYKRLPAYLKKTYRIVTRVEFDIV